jgi:hypothetical protein
MPIKAVAVLPFPSFPSFSFPLGFSESRSPSGIQEKGTPE